MESLSNNSNNIKVKQPIAQSHHPSRADNYDSPLIPPQPQSMDMAVDKSTTLINNLPNYNSMGENSNTVQGGDAFNLALMGDNEPMAANGLLGSTFGGAW